VSRTLDKIKDDIRKAYERQAKSGTDDIPRLTEEDFDRLAQDLHKSTTDAPKRHHVFTQIRVARIGERHVHRHVYWVDFDGREEADPDDSEWVHGLVESILADRKIDATEDSTWLVLPFSKSVRGGGLVYCHSGRASPEDLAYCRKWHESQKEVAAVEQREARAVGLEGQYPHAVNLESFINDMEKIINGIVPIMKRETFSRVIEADTVRAGAKGKIQVSELQHLMHLTEEGLRHITEGHFGDEIVSTPHTERPRRFARAETETAIKKESFIF